jgi:hypothetical protein
MAYECGIRHGEFLGTVRAAISRYRRCTNKT